MRHHRIVPHRAGIVRRRQCAALSLHGPDLIGLGARAPAVLCAGAHHGDFGDGLGYLAAAVCIPHRRAWLAHTVLAGRGAYDDRLPAVVYGRAGPSGGKRCGARTPAGEVVVAGTGAQPESGVADVGLFLPQLLRVHLLLLDLLLFRPGAAFHPRAERAVYQHHLCRDGGDDTVGRMGFGPFRRPPEPLRTEMGGDGGHDTERGAALCRSFGSRSRGDGSDAGAVSGLRGRRRRSVLVHGYRSFRRQRGRGVRHPQYGR